MSWKDILKDEDLTYCPNCGLNPNDHQPEEQHGSIEEGATTEDRILPSFDKPYVTSYDLQIFLIGDVH